MAWRRPFSGLPSLHTSRSVPTTAPDHDRRERVTWFEVDLLDRAAVTAGLQRSAPEVVYHLAGAAHVAHSWSHTRETFEANVLGTHHLLDAVRTLALRARILISGSAAVYASKATAITEEDPLAPASPYAVSKLAQEMGGIRAWQDDGIEVLLARAFNHIGPRQAPEYVATSIARQIAMIEAGRAEPVLSLGNLEAERDLSDVRDIVRAYHAMVAGAQPGIPYNVCSGRGVVISALLEMLLDRVTVPIRLEQDPARFRPNDTPRVVGSHARLTSDTGWQPGYSLERTLDDLLSFWRQTVHSGLA